MSDIDFQNGFIVGMATRGLTVSKTVIEGSGGFIEILFPTVTKGDVAGIVSGEHITNYFIGTVVA